MILSQVLTQTAASRANEPAIDFLEKKTTYNELRTKIARLSYLYMNEIGHNNRVAFFASNSPAVITTFFALTNIKSVCIPVDPSLTDDEIAQWMRDTDVTHIAFTDDLRIRVQDFKSHTGLSLPTIPIEKKKGGEYDTSFTAPSEHTPSDKDPILILRTQGMGSHKEPKYVALNHIQLNHAAISLRRPYHLNASDNYLTTLNWSHPFAFIHSLLLPLLTGGTVVIDTGYKNKEFLDLLVKSRVTRLIDTPDLFLKLLIYLKNQKQTSIPGLKSISVGLGILSPQLQKTYRLLKIKVGHVFGQTEIGWTYAMQDVDSGEIEDYPTGIGLAGNQYKVIDSAGDAYEGSGTFEGQLAVSGPAVMAKYVGPEKKKKELEDMTRQVVRGTWLYTGDIVRYSSDGEIPQITFLGRKDQVFEKPEGGYLLPRELGRSVRTMPGVDDAAGFVMENTRGKPILAVAAVRGKGHKLIDKNISEYISTHLSPEYHSAAVFFTDHIPKNRYGEVNRHQLKWKFMGAVS